MTGVQTCALPIYRGQVRAWYDSQAYREIVALRTDNSQSDVIVAEGVGAGHRATDVLTGGTWG